MKKEYDFSKAKRGKFYRTDLKLNIPIYLDDKALTFVDSIAKRKNKNVSSVVIQIIHSDMQLAETIK